MPNVIKGLFTVEDTLSEYLHTIANIPESVQKEMLTAEAKVMVDAQKQTAQEMLTADGGFGASGKYTDVKNGVISSIQQGRFKKGKGGNMLRTDVIFKGKQHGVRLATIAFMNEYGVVHPPTKYYNHAYRQPARPFIRRSIQVYSKKAVEAAAEVFRKFLKIK